MRSEALYKSLERHDALVRHLEVKGGLVAVVATSLIGFSVGTILGEHPLPIFIIMYLINCVFCSAFSLYCVLERFMPLSRGDDNNLFYLVSAECETSSEVLKILEGDSRASVEDQLARQIIRVADICAARQAALGQSYWWLCAAVTTLPFWLARGLFSIAK